MAYHGAIDDQYGFGYSIDSPRHRYLAEVLDAMLDGRKILMTATGAAGGTPSSTSATALPHLLLQCISQTGRLSACRSVTVECCDDLHEKNI